MMNDSRETLLVSPGSRGGRLILCEHPPVITLGRHANSENVLFSSSEAKRQGIHLETIDRGGDVTYHGPGQLMIYPIVRIGVGVHAFLKTIATVLVESAAVFGASDVYWRDDEPGLWVGDQKIAACGLHIRRGVSIHGFAFNVATPTSAWNCIVPCGLSGPGPISLAEAIPEHSKAPSVLEFSQHVEPMLRKALTSYGLGKR